MGGPEARQAGRVAASELYGLPLPEFVRERDALARRLRREGEREDAEAVAKLAKPTVAAWAVNQLARRHPGEVERLLEAGAALREAHERLLAGGEREGVSEAAAAERAAVARLVERARALDGVSAQTLERVAETLHAAAGSEEVREALKDGVLTREQSPPPFGGPALAGAAEAAPAERTAPRRKTRREAAPGRAAPRSKARAKAAPGRAERERAARAERERAERAELLEQARTQLRELQRQHTRLARAREAADARVAKAERELAERTEAARQAKAEEERVVTALAAAEAKVRELERASVLA